MSKRFAQSNEDSKIPAKKAVQVPDEYKIVLKVLNPHITCPICKGYFVEAITITECLHTFCKSCLLKHFENEDNCCPKCSGLIHQSHPSHYVSFDRTMQELVYKLVPGLQAAEEERRNAYAQSTSGTCVIKKEPEEVKSEEVPECGGDVVKNHHRNDDQVVIQLCTDEASEMDNAEMPFVRLSGDMSRYSEVDIFCNNELMGRDFSMKFIEKTRWRNKPKDLPLQLYFRKHVDF
ncbi:unnamed protein product [Enterobius vermicularis]|uniref:RING-type domain-containing protein n=1 Tax=Enterobius vermicularis TaxID=51028 RepID=A0A0N4VEL3_ENTVE|nr:unnamed protein product [Enterobius vermicularis]